MLALPSGTRVWIAAGGTDIEICKLNGVNPQSWLSHALANIQDTKLSDLDKLLPWNYVEDG